MKIWYNIAMQKRAGEAGSTTARGDALRRVDVFAEPVAICDRFVRFASAKMGACESRIEDSGLYCRQGSWA